MSGCVIRREGVRGAVWYAKYRDSAGTQVKKALGREADGWNETRAQRALGKLLDAVENGYRKPKRTTFSEFSKPFQEEYLPGRNLKRSSVIAYEGDLRPASEKTPAGHLLGFFGRYELTEIASRPELVDAYIGRKTSEGLSPKTIGNQLTNLGVMFKVAVRWKLVERNPVESVERPRVETPEMNVLNEGEIAALLIAYRELEADADEQDAAWWRLARRIVTLALGTGLRRGELLGLAWRDVELFDTKLTVRQALVRGEITTPKSRTCSLRADEGRPLAGEHHRALPARLTGPLPRRGRARRQPHLRGSRVDWYQKRYHVACARDRLERKSAPQRALFYSPGWTRTNNPPVNSRMLCQLSYRGTAAPV
jgi:integrase